MRTPTISTIANAAHMTDPNPRPKRKLPAKLTEQQKEEIRQLMTDPAVMLKDVMARYGVHTKLVYDIIGRKEGTPFRRARKILKNPMQFAEVQRLLAEAIIPVKCIAQQYGVNLRTIRRYAPPKKIKKSNFSEQTIKTILQLINESDIPIKEIALRYDVNNSSIYKAIRIHAFSTQEIEEIWRLVYKRKMKINEIAEKYKFSVRLIHIIAPLVGHKYLRPYKLSEKDFAEIQQLSGEMTQQEIAQLFGVSSATISRFLSALKPKKMRRNPRVPVPSKETQKEIRKLLTEKVPLWKIVEKFHLHPKVLFALASETTPEGESSAPQAGEED